MRGFLFFLVQQKSFSIKSQEGTHQYFLGKYMYNEVPLSSPKLFRILKMEVGNVVHIIIQNGWVKSKGYLESYLTQFEFPVSTIGPELIFHWNNKLLKKPKKPKTHDCFSPNSFKYAYT